MFDKKTIKDVKFNGQTVLVRSDYNVPISDGQIQSDLRIQTSLPTLKYLISHGAKKIIIISHLGRPDSCKNKALSLRPVADQLAKLLPNQTVEFIDDVSGPDVEAAVHKLPKGGILLLENLRFYSGEEANSADFAREIIESTHAKLFVQDGFAVLHRAHASTSALAYEIPAVAGLLVEKEVNALLSATHRPKSPVLLLIGGAKVSDKQPLIDHFIDKVDQIVVGGKIAADGFSSNHPKIYIAEDFSTDSTGAKLDIGPKSTAKILELITSARTVIWNGTMGLTEQPEFAKASTAIAAAIGQHQNLTSLICGGDTTGFVEKLQKNQSNLHFSLVSTGGGASLELLLGQNLPGLEALEDR